MTSDRPRMLLLSQVLPYPPDTGVSVRTFNTLRILARHFDITLLAFSRKAAHPTNEERIEASEALSELATTIPFCVPQEQSRIRFIWDHVRSLFSGTPYTRYVYDSTAFRTTLHKLLTEEDWDVVQLESLDLYKYIEELPDLPTVVVHHNVESQLLRRRADAASSSFRARYLRLQARFLERKEKEWCPQVDLNIAVSERDAEDLSQLASSGKYAVVPNGVDTDFFNPSDGESAKRGIVFLGGTEWMPNADALRFFCEEILDQLRRELPDLPVYWVGRSTAKEQEYYQERYRIKLTGRVPDVRPYLESALCSIVPLRVGGGTRLKITTAWAMASAVVSTSLGCEGLDAIDGKNILIRDDPVDFAEGVIEVVTNPELRNKLEYEARATACRTYSWNVIGDALLASYRAMLAEV